MTEAAPLAGRLKAAFTGFAADPDWWKTALKQGAWSLVPGVGYLALLGWQRRAYDAVRAGETRLPAAGLGRYLGPGLWTFVPIVLMLTVPAAIIGAASAAGVRHADDVMIGPALAFTVLAYVEVLRRSLAHRERFSIVNPAPSVRAIRAAPATYLIIAGCMFGAYVISFAGIYGCAAVLVTLPVGHVIAARLVWVWQGHLERLGGDAPVC